ncbi:class I SAM-dependent methyltransferase [Mastigocoleus testarum]|uniref:Methyltransferase type 11 n=1 Tax=Mastigocoleus testarum BC008 TaxID=371196 RepID=A0A0V7ZES8_9CYAN|nr:class I SAM-dependent methyltransferase [Mastigocoleus testarum]KST63076.1 methyltransferase type 11 [Mastigocoleus testarum BC008]KST69066.1 methyltransferase type 11 [Mastigocoleus testarum BC008]
MTNFYREDLAYIHDVGFRDYALNCAPGILDILNQNKVCKSLVVDLGCGSGLLAKELIQADYQVLGIDISESMINIARQRVPDANFVVASLFDVEIPPCNAVTSIGECLNYLFDPNNNHQKLAEFFSCIYNALLPGGILIFDILEPGQLSQGNPSRNFTEGGDWIVLVEKEEDLKHKILTRRITTFRQVGEYYRRDDEIHRAQLYKASDIAEKLKKVGFQVQISDSFGRYNLSKGHAAFVAHKTVVPES